MSSINEATQAQERIQPLFIGANNHALYCCHHEALGEIRKKTPIIICPPLGHEYERCHRAIKQLASALCKIGFDVLRFDYFGTGDSAGDYEQADFDVWKKDAHKAITFLKNRTGADKVAILGLRLGATIAHQVACERNDIAASVLWSPCLVGKDVLVDWDELQKSHQQTLGYDSSNNQITEVLGFGLSEVLRSQLEAMTITHQDLINDLSYPSCIIDETVDSWQKYTSTPHNIQVNSSTGSKIWMQEAMQARVPMHVVQTMVSWLQGAVV